jgi:hypothetical protein
MVYMVYNGSILLLILGRQVKRIELQVTGGVGLEKLGDTQRLLHCLLHRLPGGDDGITYDIQRVQREGLNKV